MRTNTATAIVEEGPASREDPPGVTRPARRTLADVLRVGAEVIATKGFQEASIRDIAEALGITKSTVYHHVVSKDHLLFAIISSYQVHGKRIMELARQAGPDPRNSLKVFIRELVEMNAGDPVMATLMARELRSLKGEHAKEVFARRDEYEAFVRDLILNGQATGLFRKEIDARLATISAFALANTLYQWFKPDGIFTASQVADNFVAILLQGLVSTTGAH